MSDKTNDDLEQRVEQLEQTVQRMLPDRRQALRLGGTALAGGLLGVGATNSASAGSNQVGTIGSSGSLVDVEAEDISAVSVDTDQLTTKLQNANDVSGSRSFDTEFQNSNNYDIILEVTVEHNPSGGTDTDLNCILRYGSSSGLSSGDRSQYCIDKGVDGGFVRKTFVAIIPKDYYYEVESFGSESIQFWHERGFTSP